jgi:hypothetical protein
LDLEEVSEALTEVRVASVISRDSVSKIPADGGANRRELSGWQRINSHTARERNSCVGIDHSSRGTDQQAVPGSLQGYAQWAQLVAAMLRGGFRKKQD